MATQPNQVSIGEAVDFAWSAYRRHWRLFTGVLLAMMPPASHTKGTTITARPTKQQPQKTAFQIFLATGTRGQLAASCRAGFIDPGGVADDDAVPMLPSLVIAYSPLPTGSAVPETRRTISLATTLVARVITSSSRASSA